MLTYSLKSIMPENKQETNRQQELHAIYRETLIQNGVPEKLAESASLVVSNDDPTKPNLGRTPEEQSIVREAVQHLNSRHD
jgi:hypothetical protein